MTLFTPSFTVSISFVEVCFTSLISHAVVWCSSIWSFFVSNNASCVVEECFFAVLEKIIRIVSHKIWDIDFVELSPPLEVLHFLCVLHRGIYSSQTVSAFEARNLLSHCAFCWSQIFTGKVLPPDASIIQSDFPCYKCCLATLEFPYPSKAYLPVSSVCALNPIKQLTFTFSSFLSALLLPDSWVTFYFLQRETWLSSGLHWRPTWKICRKRRVRTNATRAVLGRQVSARTAKSSSLKWQKTMLWNARQPQKEHESLSTQQSNFLMRHIASNEAVTIVWKFPLVWHEI